MLPQQNQQTNNAVATRPVDLLTASLNATSVQAQFRNALGEHKDTFVASLVDLFTGDKQLQTCKPGAIIAEALRAATLKLPLNKALGFAYIVVYNSKGVPTPTFIPGYKGYIQLAMRTGQYRTINADVVYEGELRNVNKLTGEIAFDGEKISDKVIGYFCYFELLNGFSKTLYMSVEQIARYVKTYVPSIPKTVTVEQLIAKANEGYMSKQVGWMGNFNTMALKTVIRQLISKYGYMSVEMQGVAAADITSETTAMADRNDAIAERANSQVIDVDNVQYEEVGVDTETGEVIEPQSAADNTPEVDPGY